MAVRAERDVLDTSPVASKGDQFHPRRHSPDSDAAVRPRSRQTVAAGMERNGEHATLVGDIAADPLEGLRVVQVLAAAQRSLDQGGLPVRVELSE